MYVHSTQTRLANKLFEAAQGWWKSCEAQDLGMMK